MNCPNCNVSLVMSERHGVEIDYCPQCRGIWLDRGELDKIIERSASENFDKFNVNQNSFDSHKHHSYESQKQHDYNKYKKKHWLSELFD